jgi:hypothetical protein
MDRLKSGAVLSQSSLNPCLRPNQQGTRTKIVVYPTGDDVSAFLRGNFAGMLAGNVVCFSSGAIWHHTPDFHSGETAESRA